MNDIVPTFGRRLLETSSVDALLELEQAAGKGERFTALDACIGDCIIRSIGAEQMITLSFQQDRSASVKLNGLTSKQRAFIKQTWSLEHQQSRGAWYLPDAADVRQGLINLPFAINTYGRFGTSIAWEQNAKIALNSSPDAVMEWALLDPLFEMLMGPLIMRGKQAGTKGREDQLKRWAAIDEVLHALNLDSTPELAVFRYRGGWHKLNAAQQHDAKIALLNAFKQRVQEAMGSRYRAFCVRKLAEQYYKKAKGGQAKRAQTLTKPLERMLSACFGGDWLAFLEYLGEQPHQDEQVVTAMPDIQLNVGGKKKTVDVAAEMGVPVEEVERMLAAFWQQATPTSPVEQRANLLHRYWTIFDEIHTQQTVGMKPLWGLVDDNRIITVERNDNGPYQPNLFREMLQPEMIVEIEELWGTMMLPQWPDRVVSNPFPHVTMAEAFGAALQFWHGCALTAWFVCEGPMSRTDIPGMQHYYRAPLEILARMGTPIDGALLSDLKQAEKQLGPSQPITSRSDTYETDDGFTFTMTMNSGSRRDGFELLSDVITRHRHAWADQYLDIYLRSRWESELREAARIFNQMLHNKGKPPMLKQYARSAEIPTNHWFGGDVGGLYAAIGEKAPVQVQRRTLLPKDVPAFVQQVYHHLGGRTLLQDEWRTASQDVRARQSQLEYLARSSMWYTQVEEALGRPPEIKEFGSSKVGGMASALEKDETEAWQMYRRSIEAARSMKIVMSSREKTPETTAVSLPRELTAPSTEHNADADSSVSTTYQESNGNAVEPASKRSWLDRLLRRT